MTNRFTKELRRLYHENQNHCIGCNYEFNNGDTAHLGYTEDGTPMYLCDKCSYLLKETAVRYHYQKLCFEIPSNESLLWRYIDFTKYVSLLSTRGLYFPRADQLNDIFEGAKGNQENKEKWNNFYSEFFKSAIKNPPEGYINKKTDDEIQKEAKKLLSSLELSGISERKSTFISCWHENNYESEAMWRLYSNYIDNAIAIRTNYQRLYESLEKNPSIEIGRVKYIDYSKEYAEINGSFWRKRKSFEHEKEVRAILKQNSDKLGIVMPCDISILIESIFVSPSSPGWFVELLNDVNKKYGLKIIIRESELKNTPFY